MGDVELRYRGELVGFHPTEEQARAHAETHYPGDEDSITIEPSRPIRLSLRGNLLDTFHTEEGAHAAIEKVLAQKPERVTMAKEDFAIERSEQATTLAPEAATDDAVESEEDDDPEDDPEQ